MVEAHAVVAWCEAKPRSLRRPLPSDLSSLAGRKSIWVRTLNASTEADHQKQGQGGQPSLHTLWDARPADREPQVAVLRSLARCAEAAGAS